MLGNENRPRVGPRREPRAHDPEVLLCVLDGDADAGHRPSTYIIERCLVPDG